MIQEGTEDQGNPVQEIGRSDEFQEIQGGSRGPRRPVKSRNSLKSQLRDGALIQWSPGDLDETYSDEICPFSISSSSGFSALL